MILIKNLYLSKQCGARRLLSDKGWELGSIDSLLKRIRKTGTIIRQPGSGRPRIRRVAVEVLVLSQEDKPKRHRSAREILHETAILRSSVHRITHRDLQLNALYDVMFSCCLKPIALPLSFADKQPYRLQ